MLKIFQVRLQQLPVVQAGFRKGRGITYQMANIHWITKKAREFQKNTSFCFIFLYKYNFNYIKISIANKAKFLSNCFLVVSDFSFYNLKIFYNYKQEKLSLKHY